MHNDDHQHTIHGLSYGAEFLSSLPVLHKTASGTVRGLSASQFSELHLKHILSHPPDNVLFPFLHGLEGDNQAQNMFFALGPGQPARVPRYRGLVWVLAEDDLEGIDPKSLFRSSSADSDSSLSSNGYDLEDDDPDVELADHEADPDSDSSSSDEKELPSPMPNSTPSIVDITLSDPVGSPNINGSLGMDIDAHSQMDATAPKGKRQDQAGNSPTHMHPVQHRVHPTPAVQHNFSPPPIAAAHGNMSDSLTSTATSCSSFTTSMTNTSTGASSHSDATSCVMSLDIDMQEDPIPTANTEPSNTNNNTNTLPPLLTSTFRPCDLLQRTGYPIKAPPHSRLRTSEQGKPSDSVSLDDWEFIHPRVPEGISLRNFGIQVPIYATLSDIVIYSPLGASPRATQLAKRFLQAMYRKRCDRARAIIHSGRESGDEEGEYGEDYDMRQRNRNKGSSTDTTENQNHDLDTDSDVNGDMLDADGFVKYNVFVLMADAEETRRALPHLVVRMCGEDPEGTQTGNGKGLDMTGLGSEKTGENGRVERDWHHETRTGAHTDGTDGHIDEMEQSANSYRANQTNCSQASRQNNEEGTVAALLAQPNTVDFAQREKEEMRDLTRASEIISVVPSGMSIEHDLGVGTHRTSSMSPPSMALASSSTPNTRSTSSLYTLPPQPTPPLSAYSSTSTPTPSKPTPTPTLSLSTTSTSTYFNPHVGQVFLGNSNDVPLAPDPDAMMHFHREGPVFGGVGGSMGTWDMMGGGIEWGPNNGEDGMEVDHDKVGHAIDSSDEASDPDSLSPSDPPEHDPHNTLPSSDPFKYLPTNDPAQGMGYDICIECHDLAPFPSAAHLRAAEEHLGMLEVMWEQRCLERERKRKVTGRKSNGKCTGKDRVKIPVRPPPNANAVIHLPFPSSPTSCAPTMASLMPVLRWLEKCVQPPIPELDADESFGDDEAERTEEGRRGRGKGKGKGKESATNNNGNTSTGKESGARRWSSVSALFPSFPPFAIGSSNNSSNKCTGNGNASPPSSPSSDSPGTPSIKTNTPTTARHRSFTSPPPSPAPSPLPYPTSLSPSLPSPAPAPFSTLLPSSIGTQVTRRTRPLKILLYSSDGYTESSVPALCLLMAIRGLSLPEAYLELQVVKKRSFFVYQGDLGILRRVEARLREEREREGLDSDRDREGVQRPENGGGRGRGGDGTGVRGWMGHAVHSSISGFSSIAANGNGRTDSTPVSVYTPSSSGPGTGVGVGNSTYTLPPPSSTSRAVNSSVGRPAAKSVSFAQAPVPPSIPSVPSVLSLPPPSVFPSSQAPTPTADIPAMPTDPSQRQSNPVRSRPRASTSPWLPSLIGDHQSWFNDPRFDGSFPSRVLPFLYLGNLNHATNAYMLHALGITHVVSVGECALVPPPYLNSYNRPSFNSAYGGNGSGGHFVPGKGPGGEGSLWIEEREGRIKVLDIKGVCDDGIDTLEPQLEPICEWIDKARAEGGQVLVHCRVGVSRSATVTIAYVMKHLCLPLVDAYLIVRSRRLSVLIQPNMRLLYNLCGWEIKLAKERAGGNERRLRAELARTLSWPYLAKEVHALNEKYLH